MYSKRLTQNRFTQLLVISLGCSCLFLSSLAASQSVQLDSIIAVVEEDVVLKSDFDERWDQVQQQLAKADGPVPPEDVLRKQLLDQLIIENLQLQMAGHNGIRIDDNQLNQAMGEIAGQYNMSFEQFRDSLLEAGQYQGTREALRKQILIGNFENSAVNRRINITRQEIENYLRSESGLSDTAPEYHVGHILIPNNAASSPAQREELATLLYQQINMGTDILQIAAAQQISGIAVSGGDLAWNKPENLPSVFQEIVPTLKPGEVGKPFSSTSGHHIVKLLETRGGSALQIEQFKVRHILITPTEIRTEEQAEELVLQLYARIQNGEDFADIARQNTNDPASMVSGGDLDWVGDNNLPAEFMNKVRATPIGTMTEPFRIDSGWHILEVLDQRIEDVTEENKRFQAQRILRDRKFENERENWLTEMRDTSYIEIFDF